MKRRKMAKRDGAGREGATERDRWEGAGGGGERRKAHGTRCMPAPLIPREIAVACCHCPARRRKAPDRADYSRRCNAPARPASKFGSEFETAKINEVERSGRSRFRVDPGLLIGPRSRNATGRCFLSRLCSKSEKFGCHLTRSHALL